MRRGRGGGGGIREGALGMSILVHETLVDLILSKQLLDLLGNTRIVLRADAPREGNLLRTVNVL